MRLVTRAAGGRPRLARLADARAARFVVRVLVLTVLVAGTWLAIDPSRAFAAALAVLVVSCPCAFALAVPAALTRAVAVLARRGVLVVEPDALEALARAGHFVFDKTGTLTEPRVDVARSVVSRGTSHEALAIAAALEQGNTHPLAGALRAAAVDIELPGVTNLRHVAGAGVEGDIAGTRYRLGLRRFSIATTEPDNDAHDSALVLADSEGEIARFVVDEEPRAGVVEMLSGLRDAGVESEILSGDAPARVAAIAARLGIERWQAAATPEDKLARLLALRAQGKVVAMVGDGINDAPVLAAADVAMAIGDGATLAMRLSGICLERVDSCDRPARKNREADATHVAPEPRLGARLQLAVCRSRARLVCRLGLPRSNVGEFDRGHPQFAAHRPRAEGRCASANDPM